jgi:hypothetical protein
MAPGKYICTNPRRWVGKDRGTACGNNRRTAHTAGCRLWGRAWGNSRRTARMAGCRSADKACGSSRRDILRAARAGSIQRQPHGTATSLEGLQPSPHAMSQRRSTRTRERSGISRVSVSSWESGKIVFVWLQRAPVHDPCYLASARGVAGSGIGSVFGAPAPCGSAAAGTTR